MAVIATHNSGSNGEAEVPLWECPCRECWALEQGAIHSCDEMEDSRETYSEWALARS